MMKQAGNSFDPRHVTCVALLAGVQMAWLATITLSVFQHIGLKRTILCRYMFMNVKPLTQTRQDSRRRRYTAADKADEEADQDIAPEMPPSPANWSASVSGAGTMTTAQWLAMRQTVSPDPE